jgi:hypothetical protein
MCERCRNGYKILVGKHEGKRIHGQPGRRWEGDIKMDLTGKGYDDDDWIHSAQARPLLPARLVLASHRALYAKELVMDS